MQGVYKSCPAWVWKWGASRPLIRLTIPLKAFIYLCFPSIPTICSNHMLEWGSLDILGACGASYPGSNPGSSALLSNFSKCAHVSPALLVSTSAALFPFVSVRPCLASLTLQHRAHLYCLFRSHAFPGFQWGRRGVCLRGNQQASRTVLQFLLLPLPFWPFPVL